MLDTKEKDNLGDSLKDMISLMRAEMLLIKPLKLHLK